MSYQTSYVEPEVLEERVRLLAKVAQLLSKPQNWCHDLACDQDGKPCSPKSKRAVRWCLYGAICREAWYAGIMLADHEDLLRPSVPAYLHEGQPLHVYVTKFDYHFCTSHTELLCALHGSLNYWQGRAHEARIRQQNPLAALAS